MKMYQKLERQERGLASIVITLFLMIVISLIVIGFAKITRREQRQALDRQLSTQAFYAAETGVNDAIKVIKSYPGEVRSKCDGTGAGTHLAALNGQIDPANQLAYTCLLVTPVPASLVYDNVNTDASTVIPVKAQSGSIGQIKFNWQDIDGGASYSDCSASNNFPSSWPTTNCDAGILRIDLVPTSGGLSYSGLMTNSFTVFFYPKTSGTGTVAYSTSETGANAKGQVVTATCNSSGCTATVTGLSGSEYYVRARSIYKSNKLTVTAQTISGGSDLALTGAQTLIDATGKANDVLRRISVRYNMTNLSTGVPSFAIQSRDSICKRLVVGPGVATADITGLSGDTSPCQPN
jgi:Tfp pilus assembly protein PilX